MPTGIANLIRALIVLAVIAGGASRELRGASLTPAGDVAFSFDLNGSLVPKWSNGALLVLQYPNTTNPLMRVFNKEGQLTSAVPFTIPGASAMGIYDWDRGADGTAGFSGWAADASGRGSAFIALVSPDGTTSQVTRTSPYSPHLVAVAPDDTLWTVGNEWIDLAAYKAAGGTDFSPSAVANPQAFAIRHFDRTGNLIGSFVPMSGIHNPFRLEDPTPSSGVRASKDRVAWYSAAEGRYVEISLDGSLMTDISVPPPGSPTRHPITGFAVSDDGGVFISATYPNAQNGAKPTYTTGIYALDRSNRLWAPLLQHISPGDPSQFSAIYGIDGTQLVAEARGLLKLYNIGN